MSVIKVENISKQYRLGLVGAETIKDDFQRWWANIRGKENPFLKVGELNDRSAKGDSNYVWALKDINFEVQKGEVLGIIGKNGAGKSTLLKLLAKVTQPTTGSIKVKGRIASLLEVGTGFHPELTGRENIFLNGAILGMKKSEIKSKFDEIVDFSGVGRYIDTPVKRYSSGMHVRLAFAVAAHLEPEILIVDEVLAVGDLEFQKKCLGKMKDVAEQGRTVLFVSHNLIAVANLCSTGIVLYNGAVNFLGSVHDAISNYKQLVTQNNEDKVSEKHFDELPSMPVQFKSCALVGPKGEMSSRFEFLDEISIELEVQVKINLQNIYIVCLLHDSNANLILVSADNDHRDSVLNNIKEGIHKVKIILPSGFLNLGDYFVTISVREESSENKRHRVDNCLSFEVVDTKTTRAMKGFYRKEAMVAPEVKWQLL